MFAEVCVPARSAPAGAGLSVLCVHVADSSMRRGGIMNAWAGAVWGCALRD